MDCLDVHSAMAWRRGGLFGSAISCRDPEWSSNVCGGHQHGRSHTGVIQESYSSGACDGTWANAKDIARLAKHARRWNDSAVPCATANLTMTCWFAPGNVGDGAGGGDGDASGDEDGDVSLCMVD